MAPVRAVTEPLVSRLPVGAECLADLAPGRAGNACALDLSSGEPFCDRSDTRRGHGTAEVPVLDSRMQAHQPCDVALEAGQSTDGNRASISGSAASSRRVAQKPRRSSTSHIHRSV